MPNKSKDEKAQVRKQAGARRQSDKNRSAHEESRGKPIPKLSELSREWPTREQVFDFGNFVDLDSTDDRSAAIMVSALVELSLQRVIVQHLMVPVESIKTEWFGGDNAPFRTFDAKIKLGRALGIYGIVTGGRLQAIKNIRNVFAHRALPLKFSHPSIEKEAVKFGHQIKQRNVRQSYFDACIEIISWFTRLADEQIGKHITTRLP